MKVSLKKPAKKKVPIKITKHFKHMIGVTPGVVMTKEDWLRQQRPKL